MNRVHRTGGIHAEGSFSLSLKLLAKARLLLDADIHAGSTVDRRVAAVRVLSPYPPNHSFIAAC